MGRNKVTAGILLCLVNHLCEEEGCKWNNDEGVLIIDVIGNATRERKQES